MELVASTPLNFQFQHSTTYAFLPPSIISFASPRRPASFNGGACLALKTGSDGGKIGGQNSYDFDLLQKPIVSTSPAGVEEDSRKEYGVVSEGIGVGGEETKDEDSGREREWVDWEDQILEDTVPLVGFARMVLHSGRYQPGEKLRPEHQKAVLERLLPYHPDCAKKIGCGVDYITIGYHPKFEDSRCLFIVRKDSEKVDFSYWKCIKGLIRKNYPLYADTFIQRHFQRRTRND
ncbi:hypothetical protein V2J09_023827 [Rumex salicifolius]